MKAVILALLAFTLTGCAAGVAPPTQQNPTPEEIKSAEFGAPPKDVEALVRNYMEQTLFDPFSAVYRINKGPAKMWIFLHDAMTYGYGACIAINAKNRMGGYVGYKTHFFFLRGETVLFANSLDTQFCWNITPGNDFAYRTAYVASVLSSVPGPNRDIASEREPVLVPLPAISREAASLRPLVALRFDKDDIDFRPTLTKILQKASARRPNAQFEIVAVTPPGGNPASARRRADTILAIVQEELGLSPDRLLKTALSSPSATTDEVHIYAR